MSGVLPCEESLYLFVFVGSFFFYYVFVNIDDELSDVNLMERLRVFGFVAVFQKWIEDGYS